MKPFAALLAVCVALLFGQAMSDLNLPNYMSKIVNTGIQQNGVERAAPYALDAGVYNLLTGVLDAYGRALFERHYTAVNAADTAEGMDWLPGANRSLGDTYGEMLPGAQGALYVLKGAPSEQELAQIDRAMGIAAWTLINALDTVSPDSGAEGAEGGGLSELDGEALSRLLPVLAALTPAQIEEARERARTLDDMLLTQSGTMFTGMFYTQLGVDMGALQSAYIWRIGLLMLLIALLGGAATILVSLISSRIAAAAARDIRRDVFGKVQSFSAAEMDKFSTASLITRTTNDIVQLQMVMTFGIRMVCYAPMMAIGGVIMAVSKSTSMTWLIAAACALLIVLILIVFALAMPKFKAIQKLVDKLNLVSRESLTGLLVIRAFAAQGHDRARFDGVNKELTGVSLFINRVMVLMMPIMMLIMNGMSVYIIWSGAHQIAASQLQIGDMMAFIQYAMQIIMSFLMISMMFIFIPRAAVSAERIRKVLNTVSSVSDPENPEEFDPGQRGVVTFKDVCFRYPGAEEDVLGGISFTARPGETTAIIGSTGSGKSTLVNLLMRFYDVTGGSLTVGGAQVSRVRQCDLRDRIGYIPQKGHLMSGTIRTNLAYGRPDATDEELEDAASVAQALECINEKPERLDDPISQGGTNVSGGQKQRLSIARALAKKPDILIFDDAFSALDFKTDLALRRALKQRADSATVIIVAQRVSTISSAEQIIVLDNGRIAGISTHDELLRGCAQYREIAASQLSEEELAL
jgi:ATP-binding cassette subfamily B protein